MKSALSDFLSQAAIHSRTSDIAHVLANRDRDDPDELGNGRD